MLLLCGRNAEPFAELRWPRANFTAGRGRAWEGGRAPRLDNRTSGPRGGAAKLQTSTFKLQAPRNVRVYYGA